MVVAAEVGRREADLPEMRLNRAVQKQIRDGGKKTLTINHGASGKLPVGFGSKLRSPGHG